MGVQPPARRSPPTRVTAAAVIVATFCVELLLAVVVAAVGAIWVWATTGDDIPATLVVFLGLMVFFAAAFGLRECVEVIRGRPIRIEDFQSAAISVAVCVGSVAALTLTIAVLEARKLSRPALRGRIATGQTAGLLLLWLNAVALWVVVGLLRKQSQPYAEWRQQRPSNESTDPTE